MSHAPGRFIWNELMTTDAAGATEFYTQLFGWESETAEIGGTSYRMLKAGEQYVGGIYADPKANEEAHPAWVPYVSVDDVDARAQRAEELGGRTLVGGQDIPGIGRFAAIMDPEGAVIAPFKTAHPEREIPEPQGPGTFCWYELLTPRPDAAQEYYTELFGWRLDTMPMENGAAYTVFRAGEKQVAGVQPMPAGVEAPPHWLLYVQVDDVDATAQKAAALGGRLLHGPAGIPSIGRFAVFADPQGGVLAAFQPEAAKP